MGGLVTIGQDPVAQLKGEQGEWPLEHIIEKWCLFKNNVNTSVHLCNKIRITLFVLFVFVFVCCYCNLGFCYCCILRLKQK